MPSGIIGFFCFVGWAVCCLIVGVAAAVLKGILSSDWVIYESERG